MRKLFPYEVYLASEFEHYRFDTDKMPSQIVHEKIVFSWMVALERNMAEACSRNLLYPSLAERLKNIRTNHHGRYRNLSPVLNEIVHSFISECGDLYDDLTDGKDMFKKRNVLSKHGRERFETTLKKLIDLLQTLPEE